MHVDEMNRRSEMN